jgi:thiamine-phosphate pyrophosphorylase
VRLPSPLYAILDPSLARGRDLPNLLEAVLGGGCRLVQLREKTLPLMDLLPLARLVARRCREVGALFIVNDRADLALAVGADGLHVGQDDLPARRARDLLKPGMILGVSTHDAEQARRAVADGADYIAVGSIFPTATKAGFQLVGLDLIRRVREEVSVPLVGIGGITADNAEMVLAAGADAVAVISALCAAPDPGTATRALLDRVTQRAAQSRGGR